MPRITPDHATHLRGLEILNNSVRFSSLGFVSFRNPRTRAGVSEATTWDCRHRARRWGVERIRRHEEGSPLVLGGSRQFRRAPAMFVFEFIRSRKVGLPAYAAAN